MSELSIDGKLVRWDSLVPGTRVTLTRPDGIMIPYIVGEVNQVILDEPGPYRAGILEPDNEPYFLDFFIRPDAQDELLKERQSMVCSPLQGRLILGEQLCAQIDAMADDPQTPWNVRETIKRASVWERLSETMAVLAWGFGFTDEQMDDLFRQAMALKV